MKNPIKHITTLILLLFCSYIHLLVFAFSEELTASLLSKTEHNQNCEKTAFLIFNASQYKAATPLHEKSIKKTQISDNEEEDCETFTSKKISAKFNGTLSIFNQSSPTFCTFFSKKTIVFLKIFTHLPSYNSSLYLLFEVFRI